MNETEIIKIITIITALMIAIIGHEIMHGLVAYKYGDSTAKNRGRLKMNPLVHIDPVGSILVPGMLFFSGAPFIFGWAKPVPINISTVMRDGGTNAAVAVSLAGITYNFVLAAFCAAILQLFSNPTSATEVFIALFLYQSVVINVLLGVFNLWPIPPLDGANAIRYIAQGLKWRKFAIFYDKIYPYGMLILVAVLFTPLSKMIFEPVQWIVKWLL
ncbi:site-2 protease family protein [Sulfurovum sp. TSL1]|uniref:site-2 protease family protein n=1 Tax=Sulfurovum sp. TSL1 TaxID=2826994 RepID=UPI001CC5FDC5|nr:site-2 protease family protein [Sulfurovum sp. TSL1]GIT97181.1 peptidase [Sulfurovum sp. TSL1]